MSTTPTDPPPFSDADIHRERTTFPHDLRVLSKLLSSLPHPIPLHPEIGPQNHNIQRDLPEMINDMFCIILYDYDVRNPTDFDEMKDSAGLSEEHFQGIRKKLFPDLAEWELDPNEPNYQLLLRMDQICGDMSVVEGMRDLGLSAPRFGLNDAVARKDGADSPISVAYSDDIEFFTGGRALEGEGESEEQAGAGKEEIDEQASAGKEER